MALVDVRHRLRDLGRIRAGDYDDGAVRAGETWRLTSPHRDLLDAAAALWGGVVEAFDRRDTDDRFEVTVGVDELEVLVPPQDVAAGQWYEAWSASGLRRRCDGDAVVEGADLDGRPSSPCLCDPDGRDCRPTTHLLVVLPQLPDVGVWRLTTRSMFAAAELPAQVALLHRAADYAPAVLALEPRSSGRGRDTRRFVVPILRTRASILDILAGADTGPAVGPPPPTPALGHHQEPTPPPATTAQPVTPPGEGRDGPGEGRNAPAGPPAPDPAVNARRAALGRLLDVCARNPRDIPGVDDLAEWVRAVFAAAADADIWPTDDRRAPIDAWAARYLRPFRDGAALDFPDAGFEERLLLVDTEALRTFAVRVWMAARTEADRLAHRIGAP